MTQQIPSLTENDLKPVPEFVNQDNLVTQLQELSQAVYALQRVVLFQHQTITQLHEGQAKKPAASTRKTTSK